MASADEIERFLISMVRSDLDALDRVCRRSGISRNRYVIKAVLAMLKTEPDACPQCGRTDFHSH